MRGSYLISLIAIIDQALGKELAAKRAGNTESIDTFTNKLTDNFFDRALTVAPLQGAALDDTALGKSSHVLSPGKPGHASTLAKASYIATPPRMRLRPLVEVRAQPSTRQGSVPSLAGYRPQLTREVMPGRLVQRGAEGFGEGASEASTPETPDGDEEVFYDGPPAISDAILPSLAIPTIVGLIPATAAWSRQAWVRFKVTNRGIKIQAGFGGKDTEEFAYSDVRKIRSVKRLFGDGDLIFTLKQMVGRESKFVELRNVPNFDNVRDFVLKYVDPEVVEEYKNSQSGR